MPRKRLDKPGQFLSTLSSRRATCTTGGLDDTIYISIHALLAESDSSLFLQVDFDMNFYPRSPRGERQQNATKNRFFL